MLVLVVLWSSVRVYQKRESVNTESIAKLAADLKLVTRTMYVQWLKSSWKWTLKKKSTCDINILASTDG